MSNKTGFRLIAVFLLVMVLLSAMIQVMTAKSMMVYGAEKSSVYEPYEELFYNEGCDHSNVALVYDYQTAKELAEAQGLVWCYKIVEVNGWYHLEAKAKVIKSKNGIVTVRTADGHIWKYRGKTKAKKVIITLADGMVIGAKAVK